MSLSALNPTVFSIDFPYAMRVDESDGTGVTVYQGYAPVGTLDAAASWSVKRITVSAGITKIEWANGSNSLTNVWDNRSSLAYS